MGGTGSMGSGATSHAPHTSHTPHTSSGAPSGGKRVLHQHGDRHRADPAGDGGEGGSLLADGLKVHVADKTALHTAGSHVDDDRAFLHVVCRHHTGTADGDDQDVRAA